MNLYERLQELNLSTEEYEEAFDLVKSQVPATKDIVGAAISLASFAKNKDLNPCEHDLLATCELRGNEIERLLKENEKLKLMREHLFDEINLYREELKARDRYIEELHAAVDDELIMLTGV